jgi:hypothetical protein
MCRSDYVAEAISVMGKFSWSPVAERSFSGARHFGAAKRQKDFDFELRGIAAIEI